MANFSSLFLYFLEDLCGIGMSCRAKSFFSNFWKYRLNAFYRNSQNFKICPIFFLISSIWVPRMPQNKCCIGMLQPTILKDISDILYKAKWKNVETIFWCELEFLKGFKTEWHMYKFKGLPWKFLDDCIKMMGQSSPLNLRKTFVKKGRPFLFFIKKYLGALA